MSSYYWSSTTYANNPDNAWHVNFNNGNVNNNNKSNTYYVRAVRGGKCSLLSFESIYKAYLDCRRRKRGTINALRFEYDLLNNLFSLALDLQRGTYRSDKLKLIRTVGFGCILVVEALWERLGIGTTFRDICKAENLKVPESPLNM